MMIRKNIYEEDESCDFIQERNTKLIKLSEVKLLWYIYPLYGPLYMCINKIKNVMLGTRRALELSHNRIGGAERCGML